MRTLSSSIPKIDLPPPFPSFNFIPYSLSSPQNDRDSYPTNQPDQRAPSQCFSKKTLKSKHSFLFSIMYHCSYRYSAKSHLGVGFSKPFFYFLSPVLPTLATAFSLIHKKQTHAQKLPSCTPLPPSLFPLHACTLGVMFRAPPPSPTYVPLILPNPSSSFSQASAPNSSQTLGETSRSSLLPLRPETSASSRSLRPRLRRSRWSSNSHNSSKTTTGSTAAAVPRTAAAATSTEEEEADTGTFPPVTWPVLASNQQLVPEKFTLAFRLPPSSPLTLLSLPSQFLLAHLSHPTWTALPPCIQSIHLLDSVSRRIPIPQAALLHS